MKNILAVEVSMRILLLFILVGFPIYASAEIVLEVRQSSTTGKTHVFLDGKKEVAREIYGRNDKLLRVTGRIPDGKVKQYAKDGTLEAELNYLNQKLDGEMISFFPSGTIAARANFVKGALDGTTSSYFENGILMSEMSFRDDKLVATKSYYDNGQLENQCVPSADGVKKDCTTYYKTNGVKWEDLYHEGKFVGISNSTPVAEGVAIKGKVKATYSYLDDKYDGLIQTYYQNGLVSEETHCTKGKLGKYAKHFTEDGQKEWDYVSGGTGSGVFREYNPTGMLKREASCSRVIDCDRFFLELNLTLVCKNEQKTYEYYENGQMKTERVGWREKTYYPNGQIKFDGEFQELFKRYKKDVRNGLGIMHHENGAIEGIYTFDANKKTLNTKTYDESGSLVLECSESESEKYKDTVSVCKSYYVNGVVQYIDTYRGDTKINRKSYSIEGKQEFNQDYPY